MQDRIRQIDETSCNARPDHTYGSHPEELRTTKTSPLCLPKADLERTSRVGWFGPIVLQNTTISCWLAIIES
jgi:hypothetical protein